MRVVVVDRQRKHRVAASPLGSFLARAAAAVPHGATTAAETTVLLCGDATMRRLNREFRGKDRTTDVLSFPSGSGDAPEGGRHLGDIAISVPRAARQAAAAGHTLRREVAILALHGFLHLLGYDHEVDDGTMSRLEARLIRKLAP